MKQTRTTEDRAVSVFKYKARTHEEHTETGTVIAASENDARQKLLTLSFDHVTVRKILGVRGLWGRLTADIK